jgi:hypothetical protein
LDPLGAVVEAFATVITPARRKHARRTRMKRISIASPYSR